MSLIKRRAKKFSEYPTKIIEQETDKVFKLLMKENIIILDVRLHEDSWFFSKEIEKKFEYYPLILFNLVLPRSIRFNPVLKDALEIEHFRNRRKVTIKNNEWGKKYLLATKSSLLDVESKKKNLLEIIEKEDINQGIDTRLIIADFTAFRDKDEIEQVINHAGHFKILFIKHTEGPKFYNNFLTKFGSANNEKKYKIPQYEGAIDSNL